jgi:hypothetical protein
MKNRTIKLRIAASLAGAVGLCSWMINSNDLREAREQTEFSRAYHASERLNEIANNRGQEVIDCLGVDYKLGTLQTVSTFSSSNGAYVVIGSALSRDGPAVGYVTTDDLENCVELLDNN